ncbi:MAG: rhodanese-like domain-containing protein [Armatimonadota bacterium]|nr:rhodanese-like domain-containing protein [Armatimonadota bacterium]MDR7423320.1 rhodanese-like domain-containing protein [Armatimonadota bacterium]MDR7455350.1 rhodanese-like domain-containing protein [Armatimonadota bacterium]MDR7457057.1 rhodanese-like domain-containing protein [Armatimonadota bacterium]MDR7511929.1 rhodanese-like domain-containing protein [Armatimonadota bacterium]
MKRVLLVALMAALLLAPSAVAQAPASGDAALQFLKNLPGDFKGIAPAALKTRLDAGETPFLLDVREQNEVAAGMIQGAVWIPVRTLPDNMARIPADKNAEIIVICQSSLRAAYVTMALTMSGYTNVKTMLLGMREWYAQNYPVVK